MENIHYNFVLVPAEGDTREHVRAIIGGENVSASVIKKQKHGILIRLGFTDKEAYNRILDNAIEVFA